MKKILFISLAVVLALSVSLIGCEGEPEPEPVLTIGAIYVGSIDDAGYNQAVHDSIAVIADNIADIEIIEAENVAEGAATAPMQIMIDQGADLIFATSFGYHDEALALSVANPDVVFEWCGGGSENATANFGTFFGKPPDGWYLMGMAAGLMMIEDEVVDPKLGFVAAFPIGWTRTFINAFTLGAQSVYEAVVPNATAAVETVVSYTFSWSDLSQQALVTNALIDAGADVITMHVDAPTTVIGTAETRGVYSIGFQSVEAKKFAPTKWICGTGFTFGELLTGVAQDVIDGTYVGANKYWGWDEGAMALAEWGPDVPQDVKDTVLAAKAELEASPPTLAVFEGPIYDTTGEIAALYSIPPYPLLVSENVTIPEWALGWADDFFVWGVTGGLS